MGNFDILKLKIKCPKCKKQREWEIQFKSLVNEQRNIFTDYPKYFKVSDKIDIDISIILGIGICPICNSKKWILVNVNNGIILSKYEFNS